MSEHIKEIDESLAIFQIKNPWIRWHKYNYFRSGEQETGIRNRIRQGLGGSREIVSGVEVAGHYHIPKGERVDTGDTIFVDDKSGTGGRWEVRVEEITGFPRARQNENMIVQSHPDVVGAEFQGTIIRKVNE